MVTLLLLPWRVIYSGKECVLVQKDFKALKDTLNSKFSIFVGLRDRFNASKWLHFTGNGFELITNLLITILSTSDTLNLTRIRITPTQCCCFFLFSARELTLHQGLSNLISVNSNFKIKFLKEVNVHPSIRKTLGFDL